jgi:hypothetical protein
MFSSLNHFKKILLAQLILVVAVSASLLSSQGAMATHNLVANGGFEDGTVGAANLPVSWTVVGEVDVVNGWDAHSGTHLLDLNGSRQGKIRQIIPTVIGDDYTVSFWKSANPQCGTTRDPFPWKRVSSYVFGWDPSGDYSRTAVRRWSVRAGDDINDLDWVQHSYSFTAWSTQTRLQFDAGNSGACGILLDDISLAGPVDENDPPVADAGADQLGIEATRTSGAFVSLDGSGSDDPDGDTLSYSWSATGISFDDATIVNPSATFPVGTHNVSLTVTDGNGGSDSDSVLITVVDTTPPSIALSLNTDTLWPPNHKMTDISVTVTTSDVAGPVSVVLTSITSSELDDAKGGGDGNTTEDVQGADTETLDTEFQVRAERSGKGSGRTYTVVYTATDGVGNTAEAEVEISVAKSKGKSK